MNNDIVRELTTLDEIELIYSTVKNKDGVTTLTYNIVCNIDNVVANIELIKKVVAIMSVIEELVGRYGINVNYNIKTSDALDDEINNNQKRSINELANADIIYARSEYFNEKVNSSRK